MFLAVQNAKKSQPPKNGALRASTIIIVKPTSVGLSTDKTGFLEVLKINIHQQNTRLTENYFFPSPSALGLCPRNKFCSLF